ncbi:class I SAM-dependent methyltransferase [Hyphomonas oceanitis]|uniref:class I SAM-dependent methyltransferase n=1 Tax=Hyphomonas oceanitis TaxID=81033 RepID=UPI003003547A
MTERPITLEGFERRFQSDPDPWQTFSSVYELKKRQYLGHAIGNRTYGRCLEVAAGNGSNTCLIAGKALRLVATEGTPTGVRLMESLTGHLENTSVRQQDLAEPMPCRRYDLIVVSEVLYYLTAPVLRNVARGIDRTLVPNGRLILAHHHERFPDAVHSGQDIHARFLNLTHSSWRVEFRKRTSRYVISRLRRM